MSPLSEDKLVCGSTIKPELTYLGQNGAMANQRLTVWTQITAELSGHPLRGSYAVEDEIVKVKTLYGEKATRIGSFNSEWVARRLLEELAAEGKA
jgi:glucose-6-phosphate dehydrogenase assembly protein OpcA